jgi:CheY-like chemotaxis protein
VQGTILAPVRCVRARPVPRQILYVDDDGDTRMCVETLLRAAGYAVDLAENATEALQCLRAGTYDAVVTDHSMPPGETGSWLLEQARREGLLRKVPTCILTADPAVPQGAADIVLAKPIAAKDLIAEVERLLARAARQARRARRVTRVIQVWTAFAASSLFLVALWDARARAYGT